MCEDADSCSWNLSVTIHCKPFEFQRFHNMVPTIKNKIKIFSSLFTSSLSLLNCTFSFSFMVFIKLCSCVYCSVNVVKMLFSYSKILGHDQLLVYQTSQRQSLMVILTNQCVRVCLRQNTYKEYFSVSSSSMMAAWFPQR